MDGRLVKVNQITELPEAKAQVIEYGRVQVRPAWHVWPTCRATQVTRSFRLVSASRDGRANRAHSATVLNCGRYGWFLRSISLTIRRISASEQTAAESGSWQIAR